MNQPKQNRPVQNIDPIDSKIQEMLEGKISPPDPLAEYMLDGIKQTAVEEGALRKKLQEAESFVSQLRIRLMELKGVGQKAYQDLRTRLGGEKPKPVLRPVESEPAPEPEPEKGEEP